MYDYSSRMKQASLQTRLLIPTSVTYLLYILVFVFLVMGLVRRFEQHSNSTRLTQETTVINQQLDQAQRDLSNTAALIATEPSLINALLSLNETNIRSAGVTARFRHSIDYLGVVNADKEFLLGQSPLPLKSLDTLVQLALIYVETQTLLPVPEGWMLVTAVPVRTKDDAIGAVLVGRLLDDSFWRALNLNRVDPTIRLYNTDGEVVASSTLDSEHLHPDFDRILWQQAQQSTPISNISSDIAYTMLFNENEAIYSIELANEETTILQRDLLNQIILGVTIAGLAYSLLLLNLLRRIVMNPISTLSDAARQLSVGNLNPPLPVATAKEIEQLNTTFIQMGQRLQESFTFFRTTSGPTYA